MRLKLYIYKPRSSIYPKHVNRNKITTEHTEMKLLKINDKLKNYKSKEEEKQILQEQLQSNNNYRWFIFRNNSS